MRRTLSYWACYVYYCGLGLAAAAWVARSAKLEAGSLWMPLAAIALGRAADFLSTAVALEDDLIAETAPGLGSRPSGGTLYRLTKQQIIWLSLACLILWPFAPLVSDGIGLVVLVSGVAIALANNWLSVMISVGRVLARVATGLTRLGRSPWEDYVTRQALMASEPEDPFIACTESETFRSCLNSLAPAERAELEEKLRQAHADPTMRMIRADMQMKRMEEAEYQAWLSLPAAAAGWLRFVVAAAVAYAAGAILLGALDLPSAHWLRVVWRERTTLGTPGIGFDGVMVPLRGWSGALTASFYAIGAGLAASAFGVFLVAHGGWYLILDALLRPFGGGLGGDWQWDTGHRTKDQEHPRGAGETSQQPKVARPQARQSAPAPDKPPPSPDPVAEPSVSVQHPPTRSQSIEYWRFCVKCHRTDFFASTLIEKKRWRAGLCPYCEGQLIDRETYERNYRK